MKALNPYAVALKRENPFYEIEGKPIYKNGDFSVYKYGNVHKWFVYLYKNIIITERTAASKELVDRFANNDEPILYSKYSFRRAMEALEDGKEYAKKIGFEIRSLSGD